MAGRSVLITGGCGFIGSHLACELKKQGAARIRILDSLEHNISHDLKTLVPDAEVIRFKLGTDDPRALRDAIAGIDSVFHLAALKHGASQEDPLAILRSNIEGTYALLEACKDTGVKKVVFASSLYAYGRMSAPQFQEEEQLKPVTVYGISKAAGEDLLRLASNEWGLSYNILRLFFIYGPHQRSEHGYRSVIIKNFERILTGKQPVIFGDGIQALDYVYIADAVEAFLLAMNSERSAEIYNVASASPVKIRDLIECMLAISNSNLAPDFVEEDWTAGSCRSGSNEKIRTHLGWQPRTNLKQGLQLTFEWMKTQA